MAHPSEDRRYWVNILHLLAEPVLSALANRSLKQLMPIEAKMDDRPDYTYLEALGRTLAGIAPWLEQPVQDTHEEAQRQQMAQLARKALDAATDPQSPDYLNFSTGAQPIVDAAFLAHAIVRAPGELWEALDTRVQQQLIDALRATRTRKPYFNNWLLFAAMIETALQRMGADWDPMRIDYAIKQHEQWYLGDGMYGDGPEYHADYYNSFVIQPMLVDIIEQMAPLSPDWAQVQPVIMKRAVRYAAILERSISPDGTFPPVGRSLAYRCGAFQALAQTALRRELPALLKPAQVRSALTAVIKRTLEAPGTFDDGGWLRIGLCGHQPDIGESYISTGSLYLCTAVLLPLGLAENDAFWCDPPSPWTAQQVWSGLSVHADHAMR